MISIKNLTKEFSGQKVLDGMNKVKIVCVFD